MSTDKDITTACSYKNNESGESSDDQSVTQFKENAMSYVGLQVCYSVLNNMQSHDCYVPIRQHHLELVMTHDYFCNNQLYIIIFIYFVPVHF